MDKPTCCKHRGQKLTPEQLKAGEGKLLAIIEAWENGTLEEPELTPEEEELQYTADLFEDEYSRECMKLYKRKDIGIIEKCENEIVLTKNWELKAHQWGLDRIAERIHYHWHKAYDRIEKIQKFRSELG